MGSKYEGLRVKAFEEPPIFLGLNVLFRYSSKAATCYTPTAWPFHRPAAPLPAGQAA